MDEEEQEEVEGRIRNVSQTFIIEACRTLPFTPDFLEIEMTANGLNIPHRKFNKKTATFNDKEYEEEIRKYEDACRVNNVIPFSQLNLLIDLDKRLIPDRQIDYLCSSEKFAGLTKDFIRGGRFYQLKIKSNPERSPMAFPCFVTNHLNGLLVMGYNIGDLYLQKRYGPRINLSFNLRSGMRLETGELINKEIKDINETEEVIGWFARMQRRHGNPAQPALPGLEDL